MKLCFLSSGGAGLWVHVPGAGCRGGEGGAAVLAQDLLQDCSGEPTLRTFIDLLRTSLGFSCFSVHEQKSCTEKKSVISVRFDWSVVFRSGATSVANLGVLNLDTFTR